MQQQCYTSYLSPLNMLAEVATQDEESNGRNDLLRACTINIYLQYNLLATLQLR